MGAVRMRGRTADKNITIIHKYDSSPFFDVRGKSGFTGGNVVMDYGLVFWPDTVV